MARKSFKVTVNGETFNVEVEEIKSPTADKQVSGGEHKHYSSAESSTRSAPQVEKHTQTEAQAPAQTESASTAGKQTEEKPETTQQKASSAKPAQGIVVEAPMPGSILDIKVKEGETVNKDDVLIILEAMKMENEVTSPASGKVAQIKVSKDSAVNSKDPLLVIEA